MPPGHLQVNKPTRGSYKAKQNVTFNLNPTGSRVFSWTAFPKITNSDLNGLVLFQCNRLGFSAPVVFRGKAQCAGNGCSLVKHCNAAAEHHRSARRVGLSASMAALLLLQRTTAIRCKERLALNADRPTVSQFITLKEY